MRKIFIIIFIILLLPLNICGIDITTFPDEYEYTLDDQDSILITIKNLSLNDTVKISFFQNQSVIIYIILLKINNNINNINNLSYLENNSYKIIKPTTNIYYYYFGVNISFINVIIYNNNDEINKGKIQVEIANPTNRNRNEGSHLTFVFAVIFIIILIYSCPIIIILIILIIIKKFNKSYKKSDDTPFFSIFID